MKDTINIKKSEKELAQFFKKSGFVFKMEQENGQLVAISRFKIRPYDDDVFARFEYHPSGIVFFSFTFDQLNADEQTLLLVNQLNEKNPFFRSYIDSEKKFLRLLHSVMQVHQDDVVAYTACVLHTISDEALRPYLGPLCVLSEGDNG